ncbi:Transcription factor [Niveomyces insectorum RCEF 264]|uniref:Transcription factor n=1 Tax=Niveomyces insectorum RCEF 264 TaxID=1081102 RepID=A0A167T8N3_9HYPO|nr:Transcription factor [Niveomyces insectorum RCEF 264]
MSSPRESRRVRPTKRACMDCHARKVRCDGALNGFPCSNCRSAQVDCMVAERRKRKRVSTAGSLTQSGGSPRGSGVGGGGGGAHSSEATDATSRVPKPPAAAIPAADPDNQNSRVASTCDTLVEAGSEPTSVEYAGECELAKEHLVEFFNQDLKHNPIKARSTYVGSELSNLNYLTRQRSANQHVYHYPCSNVYVPRVFRNSQSVATPNLIPKDAFVLPPKHVSDILVAEYFEHIHPGFPIIDRLRFLNLYHDQQASPSILLLQAICLAASHVTKSFKNNQDLKVAFFRRARALLDGRYEEDRMHVVQAAMLLTWFSDGGDDICANAWWWIGIATKTAVGLGMHRDVRPSKMPPNDQRTWRLIWWCLVQLDCMVSLCYGRPQSINLDDCDVPPLCLDDFDSSIGVRAANYVIHHSNLCAIVSDIVRVYFSIKARKNADNRQGVFDVIGAALAEWLGNLPPDFREHSREAQNEWDRWPLLLHLTYNTVLIQFHRPLRDADATSMSTPTSSYAEDICADSASNIIRIFDQLDRHSALRYSWFWSPNALFTAMLELHGQLKCQNPILAFQIREKYNAGLLSLRRLTRYWLYATSVLRLFQSNSLETTQRTAAARRTSTSAGDQPFIDQQSPCETVSSLGAASTSNARGITSMVDANQPDPQEMDWVRLLQYGDGSHMNMHVERNRWHNSLTEWQTLYWSDPLASIDLGDGVGDFQFDWPT